MTVIGPEDMVSKLSQTLNPQLLAELTSDILAAQGHTGIKIVDGPGDGCRDIHSIDEAGIKALSQCKFHQDSAKTVSSKEMGELPMGMIKLGYRKGTFITNGQISPQAKREYIDDYKELRLDYLDGRGIVAAILGNSVLKALWFDGERIGRVSTALVIPAIARDLAIDKPFPIIDDYSMNAIAELIEQVRKGFQNLDINIIQDVVTPALYFAPYRSPKIRTINEGVSLDIKATEIVISGLLPLDEIDRFADLLGSRVLEFIEKNQHIHRRAIAIRVGTPSLIALQGSSAGTRLHLPFEPLTLLRINGKTQEEHEWMKPSEELGWRFPRVIRASQFNQTRLHNTELNVCIEYGLVSPPSEQTRHSIVERREAFAWYWERSLFAFIPTNIDQGKSKFRLPQPDYEFEWIGNRQFRAWLYGDLSKGIFMATADEPDSDEHNLLHDSFRRSQKAEDDLEELKRVIILTGGEIVDPVRARYIVAALTKDPYPSEEMVLYGTVELIATPDDIPSPIDLTSRRLEMTVCWNIGLKYQELDPSNDPIIVELMSETLSRDLVHVHGYFEIDRDAFSDDVYIVLLIMEPEGYDPVCQIDQRITRFSDILSPVLSRLEMTAKMLYPNLKRSTEEYWQSEYDMWF